MIRGALILGIGFSLGYAKAIHDSDDILEKLETLTELVKQAVTLDEQERNQDKKPEDVIDGTIIETPERETVQ